MTTTRYDFHGCAAYLKQVLGKYACEVWLSKAAAEAYDPAAAVKLDLARTPRKAAAGEAEVDDYVDDGGATTLGPCWPDSAAGGGYGHAAEAAVFVHEARWQAYRAQGLIEVPDGEADCQTQVRVYVDHRDGAVVAIRRYYGFLATVTKVGDTLMSVEVHQLTDAIDGPGRAMNVEVDNRKECDALDGRPRVGERIGLFLEERFAGANGLAAVKIPRGLSEGRPLGLFVAQDL